MRQIIQGRNDRPSVHLPLIYLLGAVIQAGCIAQTNGIGSGKQAEMFVRGNYPAGIQQGQLAIDFQNALDNKHHICPPGVIFIKNQRHRILQCPGQNAFLELGYLLAVFQDNRILAYQVNSADMAVQINAHTWPVQPRGDLFNMGGFASAVIALHHYPAVMGKAGQNSQSGIMVKLIIRIDSRHIGRAG